MKETKNVEICRHINGMVWVRVDGVLKFGDNAIAKSKLLWRDENGNTTFSDVDDRLRRLDFAELASKLYRSLHLKKVEVLELLVGAKVIVFTHPNFVKPASKAA